jgi:PAS domain-containing protein
MSFARNSWSASIPAWLRKQSRAYDLRNETHWWRLSLQPFRHADEGSRVFDILIAGLEITQKMNLQHELEVSTSRSRSVVDAAYDAIITIDQEHNITLFNRAAENLFGYDASEIMVSRYCDLSRNNIANITPNTYASLLNLPFFQGG